MPNTFSGFDYYKNNAVRLTTATQVTAERQSRPGAVDHQPLRNWSRFRPPGGAPLFSGAQLHTSITNTSGRARYSVDFRTVECRTWERGGRAAGRRLLYGDLDPRLP